MFLRLIFICRFQGCPVLCFMEGHISTCKTKNEQCDILRCQVGCLPYLTQKKKKRHILWDCACVFVCVCLAVHMDKLQGDDLGLWLAVAVNNSRGKTDHMLPPFLSPSLQSGAQSTTPELCPLILTPLTSPSAFISSDRQMHTTLD